MSEKKKPGFIMCVCTGKCPGFSQMDIWDFINRVRIELPVEYGFIHPQLIESENFYYKYGQQWIGAIYFNYKIIKNLSLDIQIRNEYRAKATRENSEIVVSSGYNVTYFTPQLTYAFKYNWYLSAFGDIPIYKYYNGIQMSLGYALSLRLTKKIDFITIQARKQASKTSN